MKIREIITESRRRLAEHIPHPEDVILSGNVANATLAIENLARMVHGREKTTIKWDGFPAIVFGRNIDGDLLITDKHMFDKKDGSGRVTSPAAFRAYDAARGADRSQDPNAGDLYAKIDILYPVLEKIIPKNFRGFYMGDLLYAGKLQPRDGFYVFRPNTVKYRVKVNSPTGKKIAASVAGIAVHTFIPSIGESDQPLNGLGGLPDHGPVWFVTGEMTVPAVKMDDAVLQHAQQVLDRYDSAASELPVVLAKEKVKGLMNYLGQYITAKVGSGSFQHMLRDFYPWVASLPDSKINAGAKAKLLGDNKNGILYTTAKEGIEGIFSIWVAIYNLKLNIKQQIDQGLDQQDVQAFVGDMPGHEGYVVGGGQDKYKLIDRLGFSAANFAKNK